MGGAVLALWRRDVIRFLRQRSRVVGSLATPAVFWWLLGSGLGRSFQGDGTAGYLEFFLPGAVALVVLFTAVFSTISVIEDRESGFLQGVLVAPVPRASIVLGKVAAGTTLALVNAVALLIVGAVAGMPVAWASLPAVLAVLALMGAGLTGLGLVIAWPLTSTQGFHAIMNLLLVPMWLLSGAVFPATGAAAWVQAVMAVNPLTSGLTLLRAALDGRPFDAGLAPALAVLAIFPLIMLVVSTALVTLPRRE